ncbi:endothelin-converting enzyme homolog [Drosophila bipectinata]|uniref:endothelin-converting enzyme homolog n=1 Tax=Drosophila bipectinata TaxID=42026 RepID=UPI001C88EFC3|nr:endothelin-converting enzyme-like 1 [Drosophila bipectinata]
MRASTDAWMALFPLVLAFAVPPSGVLGVQHNIPNRTQMGGVVAEPREEQNARRLIASDIRKYMNLSADPCTDFFEYACGQWGSYHKQEMRSGELLTAQQMMERRILDLLQQLLAQPLPPHHHPNRHNKPNVGNVRKVRAFYDSCMSAEGKDQERRQFLMNVLKDNGGLRTIPNSNWQANRQFVQTLAELRRNYGFDILLGLEVDFNVEQMKGNSIYFGYPKLTIIPEEYCSSVATREAQVNDTINEEVQRQVEENIIDWFNMERGEASRFAGDIVSFEFELCKRIREEQIQKPDEEPPAPNGYPMYEVRSRTGQDRLHRHRSGMSLIELTSEMGNQFDFKLYVELLLEMSYTDVVYLRSPEYVKHMVRTIKTHNRLTVAGYIMYVALNELNQHPDRDPVRRARQCVHTTQRLFPQFMGEMFQLQVQRDNIKHDLDEIFKNVIKALEEQLHVEWLADNDRRAARTKLSQYRVLLPDYQSLDLSRLEFQKNDNYWRRFETVLRYRSRQQFESLKGNDFGREMDGMVDGFEVRAALAPRMQSVVVGWGLLQAPYYSYYYPKAMKYALVGQRLASALVQAFDDEGWNRQPQATSQWSDLTMSGYSNVTECQRAQYSSYLFNEPSEFRNTTRLREVLTNGSGLNVAFNAYLAWLEQQDHRLRWMMAKETLPDLNFTNTQLFFIYFAQAQCWAKDTAEPLPESMPLMQHTPERWDVNGPLSNSEEFGREFGCALGTPMNSGDKCFLY